MATLNSCPTCKKDVSSDAEVCPHCGQRLKKAPQTIGGILAAVILGLIIGWFLFLR